MNKLNLTKVILISVLLYTVIVSKIFATTISGTYYGKSCGTSCKSDNILQDPFEVVNMVTSIFGLSDKNVSFLLIKKMKRLFLFYF